MSSETRRSADDPTAAHALHDAALACARTRDTEGAERLLHRALALDPAHAPSLRLSGLLAGRAGRDAACVDLLGRAVAAAEDDASAADANVLLAAAHRRAGRMAAAEAAYRGALARSPGLVDGAAGLASLLREDGRADAAAAMLVDMGWADHAALALELGLVLLDQGRAGEATAVLARAAHLDPKEPGFLNTLGVALQQDRRPREAAAAFERALALRPDAVDPAYNLAALRKDEGATDEAVALLRRVVERAPDLAAARFALCMAHLPPVYADEAEVDRRRRDYLGELDALAAHAGRVGPARLSAGVGAAQPFLLPYQGRDDAEPQRRYGALVRRAMAHLDPPPAAPPTLGPGERLRLGVVCGHVRDHSVWRLPTRGWVEGIDRTRFELIGYHTSGLVDDETRRARTLFDRFTQGPLGFGQWRDRIVADRPHALLYPEVGMDPVGARLAALRLAPAQYASWGHPTTTGYPTIDFYLGADGMEPSDADARYTETLVRLPGLSTSITVTPFTGVPLDRRACGVPDDVVLFWCGHSLAKHLPRHDGVFAAIARRAPATMFAFVSHPGASGPTERFRARLHRAFAAEGLDADARCVFLPELTAADYRAVMAASDAVLDCLGWSGCNALVEALGIGLPIVTRPGDSMRARHGAALLAALGEPALICADEQAYVEAAVRLAADAALRGGVAERLRRGIGRLRDASGVRALERHLLQPYGIAAD